jgi:S13-like protein
MTVTLPERSLDQRLEALANANRIRSHRARLKVDVRAGRKSWTAALLDEDCATMKVFDLLLCVPRVGRVKTNRIVCKAGVSPSKTIGGLTDRQIGALLELVER